MENAAGLGEAGRWCGFVVAVVQWLEHASGKRGDAGFDSRRPPPN
jgi:hypothetical protein